MVFPALALALALAHDRLPRWARGPLWAALAAALVFRLFIYPFSTLAPEENLWAYHWKLVNYSINRGTIVLRYSLAFLAAGLAVAWCWHRARNGVSISAKPV